jgi:hypothetical protein
VTLDLILAQELVTAMGPISHWVSLLRSNGFQELEMTFGNGQTDEQIDMANP